MWYQWGQGTKWKPISLWLKKKWRGKDETISYKTIFQIEMAANIKALRQECVLCVWEAGKKKFYGRGKQGLNSKK